MQMLRFGIGYHFAQNCLFELHASISNNAIMSKVSL